MLILGLVLGHANDHRKPSAQPGSGALRALPAITVPAPPADPAAAGPCTRLLTVLPVQLSDLAPRIVHPRPDSPFVVAWGDPAVVLRCGVGRPAALKPDSADLVIGVDGVFWLPAQHKSATVWTTIDRAVYLEVTVPKSYEQPPLAALADAASKVLPPVCVVDPTVTDPSKLCTHRR